MIKSLRLLTLIALISSPSYLFANFDFNANCLNAYKSIFELKLGNAKAYVATEKKLRPNNAIIPLLENYIDYFTLITSESKADFDKLKGNKSTRLDKISDDDKDSPYYLYAQAEINLQWALIRGRYGEYFNAAMEIRRANNQLQENAKKFPNFHLNLKGLGLINAVIGNLPDGGLKSALSTLGLKGNLQNGLNMLEKLTENLPKSSYEPFYEEVVFYYAYVLTDVAHSPLAYAKTMKYTERIADTSLLKSYLQSYVCIKNGHTDEAISILNKKPAGGVYQSFPYLEYLEGVARLNKLDLTASNNFNRFLQANRGVNYIKDANLHLAWVSLLNGDKNSYSSYISKAINSGFSYNEKDKQAQNEASAPAPPAELLKARLLFDGGYLSRASQILSDKKTADFESDKDKTEFNYRMGRINDDLGKDDLALTSYQAAINQGKNLKYYFAANAALQMGKVYEKKGNKAKAKEAFNTAISMKNHEYENSIESQAKAGLRRIGN
ncbi:tetratricopeptide repeat protein [Pedobacter rhizosphaerae]|uniref:Tetratricopeptide repeat-containing protein n=1 Tax=Pedobacter rhizosphaerae TaxID=390241 RepID=A0A1H9ITR4_9SPHI|nr:tetratricopeptide repeat protein [Pedobacter rhizosphaerae]SEQ77983.1 Tetratricopeptide repeat-containing protein [Pedobacter rhizosphaerae]